MEFQMIFAGGDWDEEEFRQRGFRSDILILDNKNNYYEVNFLTLERIKAEFAKEAPCYLEDNLVIVREVTTETILHSIPRLYWWKFYERWVPLNADQIKMCFPPREQWRYFTVQVDQ